MKKLALVSAVLLAVSGATFAATQTADNAQSAVQSVQPAAQGGFNSDTATPRQANRANLPRDGKFKDGRHCDGARLQDGSRGGFINNNLTVTSVSELSKLKDDDRIVLEGVIEKQVGKDDFIFKDASGSVEVEIDRRAWMGQNITPTDKVKLFGEVDKSWNKTEVEIYRVVKIQ
ncbi:YgiW/YdeI family stress tolerance OB fold protein [Testudinibacter sp. P27/CKL/0425]